MSNDNATSTDPSLTRSLTDLVARAGGDPDTLDGQLVREMLHTTLKLVGDGADTGELKLTSRSLKELRYALKVFRQYRDRRKVTIFGSARTPPGHPAFRACVQFSERLTDHDWMVITGAGGGIMHAGHLGAGRDKSFGVAIRLPFETTANEVIEGDAKLIVFRYFFTRKLLFASQADALVLFPGGFGTQDEAFELLTLIQTGKNPILPVVMVDPPGGTYWKHWDRYVRDELLGHGLISPEDLNLYLVTDDVDEAVQHVRRFYRNYHSTRYHRDDLVIRMQRPLTDAQVDALNDGFATLIAKGRIEPTGPLEHETEHVGLPRLKFESTRNQFGRLREMIDRINEYDAQNYPNVDDA